MVSARRLALGGLAVAPAGLGGLLGGLLPRLRVSRPGRLAGSFAPLLGGPGGGPPDAPPPPRLRASRRQALPDGLAVRLGVPCRRGRPLSFVPPLLDLVRVRHRLLPPGQPLRLSPCASAPRA